MKIDEALKQNPYNQERGSIGAYIRYLRYNVDGYYSKKSEEIRKELEIDKKTNSRKEINMGLNTGYLKAARTEEGNEQYTPFYAVDPITKYIPKTKKIWCPFDCEWSAYFQTFKRGGGKSSVAA